MFCPFQISWFTRLTIRTEARKYMAVLSLLSRPPDLRADERRLTVFAFVLIANLLVIGSCLLVWNANAVSDINVTCVLLILGAFCGLSILCCMSCLLFCVASSQEPCSSTLGVQTVYPTPEFQYFTSTMLNKHRSSNGTVDVPPPKMGVGAVFQGSAFSMLSTMPANSLNATIESSSVHSATSSPKSTTAPPPVPWHTGKVPVAVAISRSHDADYLRLY